MSNTATFPKSQLEYQTPSLTTSSRLMTQTHFADNRRLKKAYDDDYATATATTATAIIATTTNRSLP
jgi:hypothetical protein